MSLEISLVAVHRDSSFPQIIAHLASCTEAAQALADWARPRGIDVPFTEQLAHALFQKATAIAVRRDALVTVELLGLDWEWCDWRIWMTVSY